MLEAESVVLDWAATEVNPSEVHNKEIEIDVSECVFKQKLLEGKQLYVMAHRGWRTIVNTW